MLQVAFLIGIFGVGFLVFFGLFLWRHSEIKADMRNVDLKLRDIRKLVRTIDNERIEFNLTLSRLKRKKQ